MIQLSRQAYFYGKLLASMAKADKRLLNVEDANAEALLALLCPTDSQTAIAAYHADKNVFRLDQSDHCFASHLIHMPVPEKLEMLKALWSVAACDGEIHYDEEDFMLKVTHQMMASSEQNMEARRLAT